LLYRITLSTFHQRRQAGEHGFVLTTKVVQKKLSPKAHYVAHYVKK
jgi:hypothetical protein